MKLIEKIIVNTDKDLIHIFFKNKENNISYEYSERFKLVVDTIKKHKYQDKRNKLKKND